jgi:SAM-dependent methyltransferase
MNDKEILDYFETQAKSGEWDSLYNPKNPQSYPFIIRFKKGIELMNSIDGKTVLDLGCGTGVLAPHIIENNGLYIGLDNSENMLDVIKETYPSLMGTNKIKLFFQDIRTFEPPDKVDILVGFGFIEYFEEPDKIIKILYDFLTPGGQVILSFPNFNSLDYLGVRLLSPFRFFVRKISGKYTQQPPRRMWNTKIARKLFLSGGFKNLRLVNYNVNIFAYPFTKISMKFTNFWARKFEYSVLSNLSFFASGFTISAEK